MSRVGQVFMGLKPESTWFALVVSGPGPTRKPGSATPSDGPKQGGDLPVYTLCVWGRSGVHWPVERWEGSLASWELEGKRVA